MKSLIERGGEILKYFSRLGFLSLALILFLAATAAHAQQICDPQNPDNGDCQNIGQEPLCYHCALVNNVPSCVPNDAFCDAISGGGNTTNQCRAGTCIPNIAPGQAGSNPSGCDYIYNDTGTSCENCQPDVSNQNCGNGICEPGSGETFANCSIDCTVPGFLGPKLSPGDPVLDGECPAPPATIVFPGPPFPTTNNLCEDGDICTTNVCNPNTGNCDVTALVGPAGCNNTTSDLCCPSGCVPPPNGATTCPPSVTHTSCDPDCLPPQQCVASPSPSPIPIPSPFVPPFTGILEGDGIIGHCSLNKGVLTGREKFPWIFAFGLSLGVALVLRKRFHKD